ncbi:MAG: polysaccharide biosynthesis protein, partial [Lachnospiraceae bacterium]|nr:polysaccharide biosynthesis protein [Lachnospiraceae bacterium]
MKTDKPSMMGIWFKRRIVFVILDIASVVAASYLALLIRFEFSFSGIPSIYLSPVQKALLPVIAVTLLIFYFFRLYHSLWAFAGEKELQNIVFGCLTAGVADGIILQFFRMDLVAVPKSFYILYTFLLLAFVFITRFFLRFLRSSHNRQEHKGATRNVMIIGAGEAGNMIVKELSSAKSRERNVRCMIDDDPSTWGSFVQGVRVIGGRDRIVECADLYSIEEIIIAVPSLHGEALSELLNVCKEANCKLRVLPDVYQMVSGEVDLSGLRDVDVEDLLGRDSVQ